MKSSNLELAVTICRLIESVCPAHGCHVALTGGTLYKSGERKDLDILFYRIRQVSQIDTDGLFKSLSAIGFEKPEGFGWLFKSKFNGLNIDMFFPEEIGDAIYGEDNSNESTGFPAFTIPAPVLPPPPVYQSPMPAPVLPSPPFIPGR